VSCEGERREAKKRREKKNYVICCLLSANYKTKKKEENYIFNIKNFECIFRDNKKRNKVQRLHKREKEKKKLE